MSYLAQFKSSFHSPKALAEKLADTDFIRDCLAELKGEKTILEYILEEVSVIEVVKQIVESLHLQGHITLREIGEAVHRCGVFAYLIRAWLDSNPNKTIYDFFDDKDSDTFFFNIASNEFYYIEELFKKIPEFYQLTEIPKDFFYNARQTTKKSNFGAFKVQGALKGEEAAWQSSVSAPSSAKQKKTIVLCKSLLNKCENSQQGQNLFKTISRLIKEGFQVCYINQNDEVEDIEEQADLLRIEEQFLQAKEINAESYKILASRGLAYDEVVNFNANYFLLSQRLFRSMASFCFSHKGDINDISNVGYPPLSDREKEIRSRAGVYDEIELLPEDDLHRICRSQHYEERHRKLIEKSIKERSYGFIVIASQEPVNHQVLSVAQECFIESSKLTDDSIELRGKIFLAAELGLADYMEFLLEKRGYLKVDAIEFGETALRVAAKKGHADVVEKLLEAKADADLKNRKGYTALMLAAEDGHVDVVDKLLERGAKFDLTTDGMLDFLIMVAQKGYITIFEKLLSTITNIRPDEVEAIQSKVPGDQIFEMLLKKINYADLQRDKLLKLFMTAASKGCDKSLEMLLGKGIDFNSKDLAGWTALMFAAQNGHADVVDKLLKAGADANLKDEKGHTALILAAENGHAEVVEKLLEKITDSDLQDDRLFKTFAIAVSKGYGKVVDILLKKGIDVNCCYSQDKRRSTALIVAVEKGNISMVDKLLNAGANVDSRNDKGTTPLMIAAYNGHALIVERLLAANANIDMQNKEGTTALMFAAVKGNNEMYQKLYKKGANVALRNKQGHTAQIFLSSFTSQSRKADVIYVGDGESSGKITTTNSRQKFKMLEAGRILNSNSIGDLPYQPRARCRVLADISAHKKIPFAANPQILHKFDRAEIAELQKFETSSVEQANDFLYIALEAKAATSKSSKLISMNYPHEICAIRTDPKGVKIKELYLDAHGFYHVKTNKPCQISYVLKCDTKTKPKSSRLLEFYQQYKAQQSQEQPNQEDKTYEEFLEAVFESKSGSCGLRVEAFLHQARKRGLDLSNVRVVDIEETHLALELIEDGLIHYLDLGGTTADLEFSKEKPVLSEEASGSRFMRALAVIAKVITYPISAPIGYIVRRIRNSRGRNLVYATEERGWENLRKAREAFLPQVEVEMETEEEFLQKHQGSAQSFLQHIERTAKRPLVKILQPQELLDRKFPCLVVSRNCKMAINQIIAAANSRPNMGLKPPIFCLDDPEMIDLKQLTVKIDRHGKAFVEGSNFLQDFFLAAAHYQDDIGEQITPANASLAKPLLIIDWSKFNAKQKVMLNTLLDQNPSISGVAFSGVDIVSVDMQKSDDLSFLSRHQELYDGEVFASCQIIVATPESAQALPAIDLEAYQDWREKLFGRIYLDERTNEVTWQKSDFVNSLERGELLFAIENCSNKKALQDFINRSMALGYFDYCGYKIAIPANFQCQVLARDFDFTKFKATSESHEEEFGFSEKAIILHQNFSINQVPEGFCIINPQLFDNLLLAKKITADGRYIEEEGFIAKASRSENKVLQIFITNELSKAQYYLLLNEAQKQGVILDIYLAPEVSFLTTSLPDCVAQDEARVPAKAESKNLKADIILHRNASLIIDDIVDIAISQGCPPENIIVINVEDFSYQDLVAKISYQIAGTKFTNFKEQQSDLIKELQNGKRIILQGCFSEELIQSLQELLMQDYAANLTLIIEHQGQETPKHLKWLTGNFSIVGKEKTLEKKEVIEEEVVEDAILFAQNRERLLKANLAQNQMLHLVGKSGVGKSSLVESLRQDPSYQLYAGLDSIEAWAQSDSQAMPVLFIDEVNIEDFHLTMFEDIKNGRNKILYKGKIYEISANHKIIFASNPIEFGGGRVAQKLFDDQRIQQINLKDLPASYIEFLLMRDIFAKSKPCGVDEEKFSKECKKQIAQYQRNLHTSKEVTIRELQEQMLQILSDQIIDKRFLTHPEVSSDKFTSTKATHKIEQELWNCLSIRKLQKQGLLPNCGTRGMLLEGAPAIGKSSLFEVYLKEFAGDEYFKIDSSTPIEQMKRLIIQAYEKGKIILIDEIDACIDEGIEKMLNLALSGQHPDETKQHLQKPEAGFTLFATSNGISLAGRKQVGPALRHRLRCPEIDKSLSYDQDDVVKIINNWVGKKELDSQQKIQIEAIAQAYIENLTSGSSFNLRDLKAYIEEEFGVKKGLKTTKFVRLDNSPAVSFLGSVAC